ncbi:MAG: CBS domain-containing protein [Bacteriovorax sp.]
MDLVGDVMKKHLEFCVPETRTPDMKYLMSKYDYDDLLVVNNLHDLHPLGVVHKEAISDETLKDVVHPFNVSAKNCMEAISTTVTRDSSVDECLRLMEANHISLIPVVDSEGHCTGIVNKSDILLE